MTSGEKAWRNFGLSMMLLAVLALMLLVCGWEVVHSYMWYIGVTVSIFGVLSGPIVLISHIVGDRT